MKYKIKHIEESDPGLKRKYNEDNNIGLEFADLPHLLVLGAIDGVGGYAGGEIAAKLCKDTVEEFLQEYHRQLTEQPLALMLQALQTANNRIYEQRKENEQYARMSCVASMALLDSENERLYFAHVGDSRGYVYREGELIKFTEDHSMVGYLEEIGEITEAEAMAHPRRNEVSKLMGEKILEPDSTYIQSGEHSFYSQDIVLFCSDGLTDLVNRDEIIEILERKTDLDEKKNALIDAANAKGGKDNITVALATYSKEVTYKGKSADREATQIQVIDKPEQEDTISEEPSQEVSKPKKKPATSVVKPTKKNLLKRLWKFMAVLLAGILIGFFLNSTMFNQWCTAFTQNESVKIDSIKIDTTTNDSVNEANLAVDNVAMQKDTTQMQLDSIKENTQD